MILIFLVVSLYFQIYLQRTLLVFFLTFISRKYLVYRKVENRIVDSHSVQFSRPVVSDSLQPHELEHARPPCSSPTPRVH